MARDLRDWGSGLRCRWNTLCYRWRSWGGSARNVVWNSLRTDKFILLPNAFLRRSAVSKGVDSLAVKMAIPEFPDVLIAIGPCEFTLAVSHVVPETPNIIIAIGPRESTLASTLAISKFPGVIGIRKNADAVAVSPS